MEGFAPYDDLDLAKMTATSSSKEIGRSHKGKRRSVSDATSPTDEMSGTANGIEPSGSGRGGKRSRDDTEDTIEEKRPRGAKKAQKVLDESDMVVDGEGDGDEGETRCVCGKSDGDEGGLMVMCEGCKVWQHVHCMDLAEEDVPDHYYCEECRPELHAELLKKLASAKTQRRPRRRSSATRTMGKPLSPSPSPSVPPTKVLGKRRNTMNSRSITYEEEMALALEASRKETGENEEEDDERPVVIVGPRKRSKKSAPPSAPEPDSPLPAPKRSRSASVTSEFVQPVPDATAVPETLDVPEQPMPEPSDEELAPAAPAPMRGRRGVGPRKGARKFPTPSVIDEHDDVPSRTGGKGRQPNQHSSRRGGHVGKRGGGHHGGNETNKRLNNLANNKTVRPASPPPFLTTWHLPDHLAHLQSHLPSDIPEPINIRNGAKLETIQERGVKVKWPTKRMTIGDMNKRVRNMLEYVTREQMLHAERQTRVLALEDAITSGKYQPITPEPTDLMDVDPLPLIQDEDVKLSLSTPGEDSALPKQAPPTSVVNATSPSNQTLDNPTVVWMKLSTEEMLTDLVSGLIAFQDRYRPRNRRHLAATA